MMTMSSLVVSRAQSFIERFSSSSRGWWRWRSPSSGNKVTRSEDWRRGTASLMIILITSLLLVLQPQLSSAQKFQAHPATPTNQVVIPHIKYGQGLNRWSFLSIDRDNHGLHSDLLCPNPLTISPSHASSSTGRGRGKDGGDRGGRGRLNQQNSPKKQQQQVPAQQLLPNEIWALKTDEGVSLLPCSLRQTALVPSPPFANNNKNNNGNNLVMMGTGSSSSSSSTTSGGSARHNGHFIENRILFINVSLVPFNFRGATPCTKYIKMMYDEEEGTSLRCRDIPFEKKFENKFHIDWPHLPSKRKEHFSLLENLEKFLQNEQQFHRQFYFQIYFTSAAGRSKRCTVQQYELDLSHPAGNARFCNLSQNAGYHELCGEFHCEDLIFPLYPDSHSQQHPAQHDGKQHHHHRSSGGMGGGAIRGGMEDEDDDYEDEDYGDEEDGSHEISQPPRKTHNPKQTKGLVVGDGGGRSGGGGAGGFTSSHTRNDNHDNNNDDNGEEGSWTRMLRMDIRLLIFVTVVPLVLFGVLIFGLELIVYFMCCRKRRGQDPEGDRDRSHQLLQNSLNVWENVPSRGGVEAQRTVSFSPMTTNIYSERKNMMNMVDGGSGAAIFDQPETPKILKSAMKKQSGEHASPTTAAHHHHYFDYDHDMPPSYIETTTR